MYRQRLRIPDTYKTGCEDVCCCNEVRWQRLDTVPEVMQNRISVSKIDDIIKQINDRYKSYIMPPYVLWIFVIIDLIGTVIMFLGLSDDLNVTVIVLGAVIMGVGAVAAIISGFVSDCMVKQALPKITRYIEHLNDKYDGIRFQTETLTVVTNRSDRIIMDIFITLK